MGGLFKNVLEFSLRQSEITQAKCRGKSAKIGSKNPVADGAIIFPVMFIILLGPAAMSLFRLLEVCDGTDCTLRFPQGGIRFEIADTFFKRFFGLMLRKELRKNTGLLLMPCGRIHTCFMRFPIDVLYLDKAWRIIGKETLQSWKSRNIFSRNKRGN